jgi:hypothetical protein
MRRSRSDRDEKDRETVELTFASDESHAVLPCRKKRRTFLECFQTMTLSMSDDSSGDEGSSCATGGSLNPSDDDTESLDGEGDVLLSDQEKAHRAIMYQLATGRTKGPIKTDVVADRLEHMVRMSRLKAATDDFNVQLKRNAAAEMMDVEFQEPVKRSNSLPPDFSSHEEPPMESIDVEIQSN